MAELRLHLGVHKTGTTFLQRWLDKSRFAPGTRWINEIERRKTMRIGLPPPDWLDGDETVVISDENLLSMFVDFGQYSSPTANLACLAMDRPHIFLALRNYADFFTSRWVQMIKRQRYRPFPMHQPLTRRWPDLLRELRDMFPDSPITIWDYEHFAGNEAEIAQLISGGRVAEFGPQPHFRINKRLSRSAVEALAGFDDVPTGEAYHRFIAEHKLSADNPRYDPWSAEQRAPFDAAYAADWDELAQYATIWTPGWTPG